MAAKKTYPLDEDTKVTMKYIMDKHQIASVAIAQAQSSFFTLIGRQLGYEVTEDTVFSIGKDFEDITIFEREPNETLPNDPATPKSKGKGVKEA